MGTGMIFTWGAPRLTSRAMSAPPSTDWVLRVKQLTRTSGSIMVVMPEVSPKPVRLSIRT